MSGTFKYSKIELLIQAKKYLSYKELIKKNHSLYRMLRKRKLLNIACLHMTKLKKRRTNKELFIVAKKFNLRSHLSEFDKGAYLTLRSRGLLEKACSHMLNFKKTDLEILNIAKKYKSRIDFYQAEPSTYCILMRRNLLKKACLHMEYKGHKYLRSSYILLWEDTYFYVGLTHDSEERLYTHLHKSHNEYVNYMNYTNKKVKIILFNNWSSNKKAIKEENRMLDTFLIKGYIPLNKNRPSGLGGTDSKKIFKKQIDKMPKGIIEKICMTNIK